MVPAINKKNKHAALVGDNRRNAMTGEWKRPIGMRFSTWRGGHQCMFMEATNSTSTYPTLMTQDDNRYGSGVSDTCE